MSIKQLIEAIEQGDAATISVLFDKLMAEKLAEAIQERKIEIAESLFVDSEVSQFEQELEEDFEQLDELSKQTLGRYVLRNHEKSASLAREKADNDDAQSKAMSIDYGSNREASKHMKPVRDALHDAGRKIQHKTSKRQIGMYRAVRNLTKEQVEDFLQSEEFQALDELSKSTLGSYVKKASADMATRYGSEVDDRNKRDSIYRKTNDIGLPHAETEKLLAKKNLDMKSFARNNRKMASRHAGIDKAVNRLTK